MPLNSHSINTGRYSLQENDHRTIVNRTLIDPARVKIGYNLSNAQQVLIENGVLLEAYGHTTLSTISEEVLYSLNITLIDRTRPSMDSLDFEIIPYPLSRLDENFSFLNLKNKDEGINNSKIVDPDINTLTPELINAKDKFIDRNDPFYEQDDEMPENRKFRKEVQRHKNKQPLITLADNLCMLHLSTARKTTGPQKSLTLPKNKYLNHNTIMTKRRK